MPLELKLFRTGSLSRSVRRFTKRIFRRTITKIRCSFPNEIYALIFEHLTDDLSTLKNISLVCRDFAAMARPIIFRDIWLPLTWKSGGSLYPLVKRFWLFIIAHPSITDSVRTLSFSTYEMSGEDLERLHFILAHLQRLEEIWVDKPQIYHLNTIETSFSDTLKELHCSHVILKTAAHFAIFQNTLNSLTALKVFVLDASISRDARRPLIVPCTLKILSLKRTDVTLLHCVGLGLAMSSNPPLLRVLLLELAWSDDWHRWPEENPHRQNYWSTLGINGTLVVFDVQITNDTLALITPMKDMRVSQVMLAFGIRFIHLVSLLTRSIPELPDTVHDICIDIDAHCRRFDPQLVPKKLRDPWFWLDSLLVRRYKQGLLTRIRFRCTSRTTSFGYGGSFGRVVDNSVGSHPTDREILKQIESLLPDAKRMGFLEIDYTTKYFQHSL
ncbi:hypothetical protein GYMLUDRAFT_261981 [Collybiopsis luxurians FD-317 M1]|uniref:F-box domain-containing protein n=1 Tax=Collybiopsis luxurians FD-317 M1 TaxID=944289 RepID=A0A0D0BVL3_9AGAR|nr:hypothetical protein GYMLUDRAFT_261981 [Collybiopsis luxurians FD-317 M1]